MKVKGKALKVGSNIDTDVIIPGRYLTIENPLELAKHAFEPIYPGFTEKARKGVVLVAGGNFGCGSSREQAPLALKHAGVKAIIAESFARIFFRNSINIGLPVLVLKDSQRNFDEGDHVEIDLDKGIIENIAKKKRFQIKPLHPMVKEILEQGGLINYLKRHVKRADLK